jgi:PAS domain S-box-containing protein
MMRCRLLAGLVRRIVHEVTPLNRSWRCNALVVAAYLSLALVARLTVLPADINPPIRPAAGLALAALLLCGPRAGLAIAASAFLIELSLGPVRGAYIVAAAIASGAALQAWLGAALTRRLFAAPEPLTRDRDVLQFLALAGPVACVIGPMFGVAALVVGGHIPAADVMPILLGWWVGETSGVVLFAPLALLAWPGPRRLWEAARLHIAVPLLGSAALLAGGHYALAQLSAVQAERAIHTKMDESHDRVSASMQAAIEQLRGVQRFFHASDEVTAREFSQYAEEIPGKQGIVSVHWLTGPSAPRRLATDHDPEPAAGFRVRYVEPASEQPLASLGYESAAHRAAMMRARDTGAPHLALAPAAGTAAGAAELFVPVYNGDHSAKQLLLSERRASLSGYIVAPLDIGAMLAPLAEAASAHQLGYSVVDVSDRQSPMTLVDTLAGTAAPRWTRVLEFGGRSLRLEMARAPMPGVAGSRPGNHPALEIYLALAGLIAFLISLATLGVNGRAAAARIVVAEQTDALQAELSARRAAESALRSGEERYRRLFELSPFAVFVHRDGRIVYANDKTVELFGAPSAATLLEAPIIERLHPEFHAVALERMRKLCKGEPQPGIEFKWRRFDGAEFDGESTAVPCEHEGEPAALVMMQDVTARRQIEQQVDRFFSLSLDLLCIASKGGGLRRINQAFADTLGWSVDELLSRPMLELVHPADRAGSLRALGRLARGRPLRDFGNRVRCKDGSWRWLSWTAVAHSDGLIYATARDITEQRRTADELARLTSELRSRIDERTAALDALSQSQEEIRGLVDNLTDGVATLDENGLVASANPAMARLFGCAADQFVGRSLSTLIPEAGYIELGTFLDHYVCVSRVGTMDIGRELAGRHKDGHSLAIEFGLSRYVAHGRPFYVATFRDISERKRLTIELTAAQAAAEQSNRAKSAFLAAMSHEIRTPMNAVMGMAELLEHTTLTEQQSELLATIRSSAAALLAIVDDILDFSKIEAGRMVLEPRPVVLGDTIEQACTMLAPLAVQRAVEVRLFVDPELPTTVLSDEVRLRQIVYNLLGNAIKFSGGRPEVSGRVSVRVDRPPAGENLRLVIEDNGIGISAEAQAKLFAPFAQSELTTTRRYGGTGLGLAICRRLITMMGGTIEVQSTVDVGATFTVTLPLQEVSSGAPAETAPDLSGLDCVVIDDDFDSAAVAAYLQHAGARTRVAADETATDADPQALRLSIRYADRASGCDLPGQQQLKVTRPASGLAALVTINSGIINRMRLLKAVAYVAGRSVGTLDKATDATPLQTAAEALTTEQAMALGRLVLVAEDDAINQKVIARQLELIGYAAEIFENGARALEAWRSGRYALVLTDLQMPEMDGYALAEAIRNEEPAGQHTPLIALTANAVGADARRARAEGFDGYLTKPVKLAVLRSELQRWLATGREPSPASQPPEASGTLMTIDPNILRSLVGDDPVMLSQLYSDFVNLNRRTVEDLISAVGERDVQQVRSIAHRLKSSSHSVGALRVAELCRQLEAAGRAGDSEAAARQVDAFEAAFNEAQSAIARLLAELAAAPHGH